MSEALVTLLPNSRCAIAFSNLDFRFGSPLDTAGLDAGSRPQAIERSVSGVPHRRRERHLASHPVHVTMRTREGLPSLRSDRLLLEAMRTSIATSEKNDFRVVHYSIQSNHLHLIVEATNQQALAAWACRPSPSAWSMPFIARSATEGRSLLTATTRTS